MSGIYRDDIIAILESWKIMADEKILIVEDEPAVARGLEYALKKEGYQVVQS